MKYEMRPFVLGGDNGKMSIGEGAGWEENWEAVLLTKWWRFD